MVLLYEFLLLYVGCSLNFKGVIIKEALDCFPGHRKTGQYPGTSDQDTSDFTRSTSRSLICHWVRWNSQGSLWNLSRPSPVLPVNRVSISLKTQGFCYLMYPPDFLSKALTEPASFIVLCTKGTKRTPP